MSHDCDGNTDANGLVATPMLISHVGAKKWKSIDPEGIEGVEGAGNSRAFSESAGDTLVRRTSCARSWIGPRKIARWERLVDEIGDCMKSDSGTNGQANRSTYTQLVCRSN